MGRGREEGDVVYVGGVFYGRRSRGDAGNKTAKPWGMFVFSRKKEGTRVWAKDDEERSSQGRPCGGVGEREEGRGTMCEAMYTLQGVEG